MSDTPSREQARQWISVQLEALNELRIGNARNPAFREWRQTTLNVAERIWPENKTRLKRFRRIPFQSASAKDTDRSSRNAFEKGCSEARRLLLLWIAEINLHGVLKGERERRARVSQEDIEALAAAELEPDDGSGDDETSGRSAAAATGGTGARAGAPARPPAGKPGSVARREGAPLPPELQPEEDAGDTGGNGGRKGAKKSKPKLKEMLDLGDVVRASETPERRGREITLEDKPVPAEPEPGRAPETASGDFKIERMERAQTESRGPDALERMISAAMEGVGKDGQPRGGKGKSSPAKSAEKPAEKPEPAPAAKSEAAPQAKSEPVQAKTEVAPAKSEPAAAAKPDATSAKTAKAPAEDPAAEAPPDIRPEPAKEPVASDPLPVERVSAAIESEEREGGAPATPADPLPLQSVSDGLDKPKAANAGTEPEPKAGGLVPIRHRAEASEDAVESLMLLAADLTALGVPEDELRTVRAALLGVARHLDTGTLTWGALEDVVARSIHYPKLARLLLPLILPHLDAARRRALLDVRLPALPPAALQSTPVLAFV